MSLLDQKYYLHRCLRGKKIAYNSKLKTVFIEQGTTLNDKHILRLTSRFNYVVQYIIS